jgi:hypothetical protein
MFTCKVINLMRGFKEKNLDNRNLREEVNKPAATTPFRTFEVSFHLNNGQGKTISSHQKA